MVEASITFFFFNLKQTFPGSSNKYCPGSSAIVETIPKLKPNRILAAITFTNSATDSIKGRLQGQIQIQPNVFIGTNYSFFNQFILIPFASLFGYVGDDKVFLEIDLKKMVDKIPHNKKIQAIRNKIRSNVVNKLLSEGKVPFGQFAWNFDKLIKDAKSRGIVCNRIQFLFKDEFQDTDTLHLRVFDAIRKGKKTEMYSVGVCGRAAQGGLARHPSISVKEGIWRTWSPSAKAMNTAAHRVP